MFNILFKFISYQTVASRPSVLYLGLGYCFVVCFQIYSYETGHFQRNKKRKLTLRIYVNQIDI